MTRTRWPWQLTAQEIETRSFESIHRQSLDVCWYLLYSLSVPLVHMLFLYTRSFHLLSGSLLATTHCWSALTIIRFHILWLITQPTHCLLPMDPLIIDSESCETLSDMFLPLSTVFSLSIGCFFRFWVSFSWPYRTYSSNTCLLILFLDVEFTLTFAFTLTFWVRG